MLPTHPPFPNNFNKYYPIIQTFVFFIFFISSDIDNRGVTNFWNAPYTCFYLLFVLWGVCYLIVYNTDNIIFATFMCAFYSSVIGGEWVKSSNLSNRILPPYTYEVSILVFCSYESAYLPNLILDPPLVRHTNVINFYSCSHKFANTLFYTQFCTFLFLEL